MAFTRNGDPSDTKFAMIDRSIAHLIRSVAKSSHTEPEFKAHLATPAVQQRLSKFRMLVCLTGAVRLLIKNVPMLQPSTAYANKVFDHFDEMVQNEYNLPKRSPRKTLKREENLLTMACMNAVSKVYMFQQTAVFTEYGRLDERGEPQTFRWAHLAELVRNLVATPEMVLVAWSQSLDYNIGTAPHMVAAMTAICEHFHLSPGDVLRKPIEDKPVANGADGETEDTSLKDKESPRFPPVLDAAGMTEKQCKDLQKQFEISRRETAKYRQLCQKDGVSERAMSDPWTFIESVMKNEPSPQQVHALSPNKEYMPLHASCIMSCAATCGLLSNANELVIWMHNERTDLFHRSTEQMQAGVRREVRFAPSSSERGACTWNAAWMRTSEMYDGMRGFSDRIVKCSNTCRLFDIPTASMRDMLWLATTRDNSRRCTEPPRLPASNQPIMAFEGGGTQPQLDGGANGPGTDAAQRTPSDQTNSVRMRGPESCLPAPDHDAVRRNPNSMVPDSALQRRLDRALRHSRLPAMTPVYSNVITDCAPLRVVTDGEKKFLELNTSAAVAHVRMVAEASLRCALVPGMRNAHEQFCANSSTPNGFSVSAPEKAGDSAAGSSSAEPMDVEGEERLVKLPYSYDIVSISLTLDALSRFYDDLGPGYAEAKQAEYGAALGMSIKYDDLPHLSTRFPGLAESSDRMYISARMATTLHHEVADINVRDEMGSDDIDRMRDLVTHHIGHYATDEEVEVYLRSRHGARALSGCEGKLFSLSFWANNAVTDLRSRGMVTGADDPVALSVMDEPYMLLPRIVEKASKDINALVDRHPDMEKAQEPHPGDDDMDTEDLEQAMEDRKRLARFELFETIDLPDHLDELRDFAQLNWKGQLTKRTFEGAEKMRRAASKSRKRADYRGLTVTMATGGQGFKRARSSGGTAVVRGRRNVLGNH
jgi:hypothetical protein